MEIRSTIQMKNNNNLEITQGYSSSSKIAQNQFTFDCYVFRLIVTNEISFREHKSKVFHNEFGKALKIIDSEIANQFYNPQPLDHWPNKNQKPPRPYSLIAPLNRIMTYQPGDTLELGLTLFGHTCKHFQAAFTALEFLGKSLGLGTKLGRYQIEEILQLHDTKSAIIYQHQQWLGQQLAPLTAADIISLDPINTSTVTLRFITPLQLQNNNKQIRTPPEFQVLIKRLLGRIDTLAALYCGGALIPSEEKTNLPVLAETINIIDNKRKNQGFVNNSTAKLRFSGYLGDIIYAGNIDPFMPWLQLGQWLGIGKKTSFGLGLYSMTIKQDPTNELY